jgi:hypothetical protein
MPEGKSLINLGDLGKAAETLINRVSDAVGGIAKPWQIERVAAAEARAEVIRANARVEVSEIEQRAILRMVREEGKKQEAIEAITVKSLEYLKPDATPENIEEDWLTNFFEKSRAFSDEEMRAIWAKVLAGEANNPTSFSRRTVDMLASMDKTEAELFTRLGSFMWNKAFRQPLLVVPSLDGASFKASGLKFDDLVLLAHAGLIVFQPLSGFSVEGFPGEVSHMAYFQSVAVLRFPSVAGRKTLATGPALLTRAGRELAMVIDAEPKMDYRNEAVAKWAAAGVTELTGEELQAYVQGIIQDGRPAQANQPG